MFLATNGANQASVVKQYDQTGYDPLGIQYEIKL